MDEKFICVKCGKECNADTCKSGGSNVVASSCCHDLIIKSSTLRDMARAFRIPDFMGFSDENTSVVENDYNVRQSLLSSYRTGDWYKTSKANGVDK